MMAELADWISFYVMVGSAAGALIGLQFVVLTLLAQTRLPEGAADAGAAFMTPTIIHFGVTLLISGIMLAPWQSEGIAAVLLCVIGFSGLAYTGIIASRMRRQDVYNPQPEDWLFHVVLPLAAYALLALSLFAAPLHLNGMLFGVGTAALLLLFAGIHNAWDNVSYHVFFHRNAQE